MTATPAPRARRGARLISGLGHARLFSWLLLAAVAVAGCEPASDLAITDVTVIDAVHGVRTGQTVFVRDGRITAVEPSNVVPRAVRVLQGADRFLIPGLWDMHVHLTYDGADPDALAEGFLDYGITSVRDTGGMPDIMVPVVERLRASREAPRVFFGGPLLDGEFVVYDGVNRPEIGTGLTTPEAARERVDALAAAGVDFVKVYEMVSPQVFAAVVEAARGHGLPVASHVPLSMSASQAGPHVQSVEHLRNVELDCAANYEELQKDRRAMLSNPDNIPGASLRSAIHNAQRLPAVGAYDPARCATVIESLIHTIQVPTLRLNAISLQAPFDQEDWTVTVSGLDSMTALSMRGAAERWRSGDTPRDTRFAEWSLQLTGLMHAAGVPIGAGTDTPIGFALPGYALHNELGMLVRAGLLPEDALRAATVTPAEFLGLEGEMGAIAPGMVADLVLLDRNPLADIRNTRRILSVVSKGRVVRDRTR